MATAVSNRIVGIDKTHCMLNRFRAQIHQIFIIDAFGFGEFVSVDESLNMSYRFAAFTCIFHQAFSTNMFCHNENPLSYFSFTEDSPPKHRCIGNERMDFNRSASCFWLINKCVKSPSNVITHIANVICVARVLDVLDGFSVLSQSAMLPVLNVIENILYWDLACDIHITRA